MSFSLYHTISKSTNMNSSSPKPNRLSIMRHSCSHVLAAAVQKLYPKTKFAIGPAIDNGFYYDFDFGQPFSETGLTKIEAEMARIIRANLPFEKREITSSEAKKLFAKQPYKQELIADLVGEGHKTVSIYTSGDFIDLCSGPHVASTGKIGPLKLLSLAGAYWQGDENKPQLTRIYGTCFANQKDLDLYLFQIEEAKKQDHRLIGKKLDLFSFHSEAAPGDVFWHPKGYLLMKKLTDYWREEHEAAGYQEVRTPEILKNSVWQTSGHLQSFADKMYRVATPDSKDWNMSIKPMNCDGGILIYQNSPHSYRELPLRMGELGVVHRFETSGELHGIIRTREFTQDDAHIFCRFDQLKNEILSVLEFIDYVMRIFQFEYEVKLSTRPKKFVGTKENWDKAEEILKEALVERNISFEIDPGAGVFYGPKIDIQLKDVLGRFWQGPTVQVDFNLPERFDLTYVAENNSPSRPVMVHRAILGSIERFFGALIEHYAGKFPLWLAPLQISILGITTDVEDYALKIKDDLQAQGFRVEADIRGETLQKKIREKELLKIPYMVIVGKKEKEKNEISLRARGMKNIGNMKLSEFVDLLKKEEKIGEVC